MGTSSALGFESKLSAAADALRNNMDAAEYKHVVLGLIFLKYISDAFEAKHRDPEDSDEYRATNILWVRKEFRWSIGLYHQMAGENEHCHAAHRGADRAWRYLHIRTAEQLLGISL